MASGAQVTTLAAYVSEKLRRLYRDHAAFDIREHIYLADDQHTQRTAETLVAHSTDELAISIRVSPSFIQLFEGTPCPSHVLNHENLNLFLVVAEEVSHFHCLANAAIEQTQRSQYDLELQAEFDKFALAAMTLAEQSGREHLRQLGRLLFDHSYTYVDHEIYERAGDLAAYWWWGHINAHSNTSLFNPDFNRQLQNIRSTWGDAKKNKILDTRAHEWKRSA